jgi:formylglycine-generating enzyme required for sulfatase activity
MKRALVLAALGLAAGSSGAAEPFSDCKDCGAMVVVEPGVFRMGSPADEAGRAHDGREGPVRELRIARRFALGRYEVTVGEFQRFVADTGYLTSAERDPAGPSCLGWLAQDSKLAPRPGMNWRTPGYAQSAQQPVVCVSWNDAQAYVQWLSQRSGQAYRLASEAEWEYAARAGAATRWPWGDAPGLACRFANVADQTPGETGYVWPEGHACSDGHFFAAPVGSYQANAFGLYDMIGNVWEWVQDCYSTSAFAQAATPLDGSPLEVADCKARGLKGGAWISGPERTRPAYRGGYGPDTRVNVFGFRVARSL